MELDAKIYVAGHRGMVGSAIVRELESQGYTRIIGRSSSELDLTDQSAVSEFFAEVQPDYVILAAAKVGGIHANQTYPADFIFQNLAIQNNVIHQSYLHQVKKLLFLGSSCIYPKMAPQPLREDSLLTGPLEPSNEAYALAKISGLRMCAFYRQQYGCDFISAMPTNLYGPHDNFDLKTSHVLPALIRKFHEAKREGSQEVTLWGSGTPLREFLYVDDLAQACVFLMKNYSQEEHVNIGTGIDLTIKDLALKIAQVVGFEGEIIHDLSKPDGTPRKLMNVSKLKDLGWQAETSLDEGIPMAYQWFLDRFYSNTWILVFSPDCDWSK